MILRELGRWATRSPLHDPTLPLSAASLLMSFRTMYSSKRAKGEAATIGFGFAQMASSSILIRWCSPPARRAARLRADSRGRPDDARLARLCRPSRRRGRGKRRTQADRRPETFRSVPHLVSTARKDRMIRCRRSGSDRCKPWTDVSLEPMQALDGCKPYDPPNALKVMMVRVSCTPGTVCTFWAMKCPISVPCST